MALSKSKSQSKSELKLEVIADRLAELGHPTRLMIFRHLVKSGHKGVPVSDIQQALKIPGSTLSHHIAKMVNAGLIQQVRDSRTLLCSPQFDALNEVIEFLQEECCSAE